MSDTTTRCTFTRDSLTIDGITRPAEYSVTPAGTVFVFVAVDVDGQERKVRIKIPADDPRYAAALAAAQEPQPEPEQAADKRPDIRHFADTDFEWDNRLADCWQLHFSILRTKHCLPVHPWNNVLPHSDRCSRCFAGCLLQ